MNAKAASINSLLSGFVFTCCASTGLTQVTGGNTAGISNAATPPAGETVELSPFIVSTSVEGYMASNTISGTAMNAPLREVPMTINVITSEFLEDALVGDLANAFDYNSSITQTNRQPVGNRQASWSIRGFRNRNILIDGVSGGDFIPTQLIDRIEVVKGPNTLYGQSDPGGLVNVVTKRPAGSDRARIRQRFGQQHLSETTVDYDAPALGNLRLRLLGSHLDTNGWRPIDGRKTSFLGLTSDFRVGRATTLIFNVSGSETEGIPAQRATFSFEQMPRDLNGDGDALDIVSGENERSIRHNNTFLPRTYTSATGDPFFQDNYYLQAGLRHRFSPQVQAQYMFVKSTQDIDIIFREFNTFSPAGVADGNHTLSQSRNITDAHMVSAFLNAETGPFKHQALAGIRFTADEDLGGGNFRLRSSNARERGILQSLIDQGRRIRLSLTRDEILAGVPIWEEELPTRAEMVALAPRTNNNGGGFEDVTTYFLTDSIAMLEGRARLLAGVRHIRIENHSVDLEGRLNEASVSDQKDTSFQVGGVYNLTSSIIAFANYATAFNPNGRNPDTGLFDPAEESRAYEAGLKFDGFWGGRIGGSIAYFHIEKDNVVRTDFNPFTFVADRDITSDLSEGAELELFVNLTDNWNSVLSYSYIHGEVLAAQTLARGLRLEGAAPQRLTFWTSYGIARGPLKGLRFGGGVVWADGPIQQFGTYNNRFVIEDGSTEVDLFARYPFTAWGKQFEIGINVDNLTDTFFIRSRAATNTPRQLVFSLSAEL
jgi:iron complex outermembrane receptor protein